MKACEYCGAELVRGEREQAANFRKRRFCGRDCVAGGSHPQILPWHAAAEAMWYDGATAKEIGAAAGVSRNVIIGLASRRGWKRHPGCELSQRQLAVVARRWPEPSTLLARLDAIHARFDALMEELKHWAVSPSPPRRI